MKKIILLSLIILLNTISSYSQSTWFWQQPLPTGNFLYSVDFINANTGYAAGTVGTIMKTTNGGVNWTLQSINTTKYFSSVSVINENVALVSHNYIYRTSNGGTDWIIVYNNPDNILMFLDFPTNQTGYAAGGIGILMKSTNSGIDWIQQTSPIAQAFFDISFSDSIHGMASAFRGVVMTSNGGINWNYTNFNLQQFDLVTSCSSVDSFNAYAVTTFGYLFKTTDGGLNWSNSILPNESSNIPRQCSFANRDTGYIVTSFGNILRTTDGSMSWQTDSTFNPPHQQINVLYDVMALDINNAFVCGAGGRVIKTTNTGTNWITATGGNYNFTSNFFTSENTGYTVGTEGSIMKTPDGGDTWIQQQSNTIQNLNDVYFVNSVVGYVCGDTGTILKTTNGGSSWTTLSSGVNDNLNGVFFTDENIGTSVGNRGKIIGTTNGGTNWLIQTITPAFDFNTVNFISPANGMISSDNKIYTTANGGINWLERPGAGTDLCFPDSLIGYATFGSGLIFKTTNFGINWTTQSGNVIENLNAIFFINNDNGFAVGDGGAITRTTNGGLNWISQNRITNNDLRSVYFVNGNTGYIAGDFGTLIKTTDGGLVFISANNTIIPENYLLHQNYPNPFNSSTVIKYEIPKDSEIQIKMYNVGGKEINTLVNEKQNSGTYQILIDASNFSTGIYFYSFYVNSKLMDTKKLILIK